MRDRTPTGSATGSRPKTRTVPLSARKSPRMCLMSVVLPAPFAPTRPYTAPRGIDRLTEDRAVRAPKRRVSPVTLMTGSFIGVAIHEALRARHLVAEVRYRPLVIERLYRLGRFIEPAGPLALPARQQDGEQVVGP